MLNESEFKIAGYCFKCGNMKYEGPAGDLYHTCYCYTIRLKPRIFNIPERKFKKPEIVKKKEDKDFDFRGYTA